LIFQDVEAYLARLLRPSVESARGEGKTYFEVYVGVEDAGGEGDERWGGGVSWRDGDGEVQFTVCPHP
jgi:hypothetical protein